MLFWAGIVGHRLSANHIVKNWKTVLGISRHEQMCLSGLRFENRTDKQKYFYVYIRYHGGFLLPLKLPKISCYFVL